MVKTWRLAKSISELLMRTNAKSIVLRQVGMFWLWKHRCPGHLYAQLHSKFSENHFHVVDNMYRASQYDHKSNSYNKKKLSQRWHKFEDGTRVQRDIYSAFLLLCHNDDFKTINQDICISKYETFKKAHDKCISDIKTSGQKVCNSGI